MKAKEMIDTKIAYNCLQLARDVLEEHCTDREVDIAYRHIGDTITILQDRIESEDRDV